MLANIIAFLVWCAGSYAVYRFANSPWWIVGYAAATILLFIWLVRRANKKNQPQQP